MRLWTFQAVWVLGLALSGCAGELTEPVLSEVVIVAEPMPDLSTSETIDAGHGDASSTADASTPIDMDAFPGDDVGSPADLGPADMGPADMGTPADEPDFGDPVWENACESGPLETPIPGCSPTPLPTTGDVREDCVRRINQFRWECQCLPPLQRWVDGEACADQQALYDSQGNGPHAGFRDNVCSPRGSAQNECPGWGSWSRAIGGCLQQMWDEGPGEPFSAHGHYINMSSPRYSRVACGEGGGWFVQNFN